jgi:hypothetical protein
MMQQADEHYLNGARKLSERPMNTKFGNCLKGCRRGHGSSNALGKRLSTKGTGLPVPATDGF